MEDNLQHTEELGRDVTKFIQKKKFVKLKMALSAVICTFLCLLLVYRRDHDVATTKL
jgi:hypothetical protein